MADLDPLALQKNIGESSTGEAPLPQELQTYDQSFSQQDDQPNPNVGVFPVLVAQPPSGPAYVPYQQPYEQPYHPPPQDDVDDFNFSWDDQPAPPKLRNLLTEDKKDGKASRKSVDKYQSLFKGKKMKISPENCDATHPKVAVAIWEIRMRGWTPQRIALVSLMVVLLVVGLLGVILAVSGIIALIYGDSGGPALLIVGIALAIVFLVALLIMTFCWLLPTIKLLKLKLNIALLALIPKRAKNPREEAEYYFSFDLPRTKYDLMRRILQEDCGKQYPFDPDEVGDVLSTPPGGENVLSFRKAAIIMRHLVRSFSYVRTAWTNSFESPAVMLRNVLRRYEASERAFIGVKGEYCFDHRCSYCETGKRSKQHAD